VRRRRTRLQPVQHLRQLPFQQLEFSDLLPHRVQLLLYEGVQAGPHGQTFPTAQLCRQRLQLAEGEAECPRPAYEQESVDIVAGVVSVPGVTPAWHRQHTDLLVIANGFCRDASRACELAHR
jgi:hypothetical protein